MKFIDTSIEGSGRLREVRKTLNWCALLMLLSFLFSGCYAFYFYLIGWKITGLYFVSFALMDLILLIALILKREIYSIAILIKEGR